MPHRDAGWTAAHAKTLDIERFDQRLVPCSTQPRSSHAGWPASASASSPGLSTPGMLGKLAHAEHLYAGFGDRVIVLDRAAAYPNGADENPILIHDRQSAREGNQPVI